MKITFAFSSAFAFAAAAAAAAAAAVAAAAASAAAAAAVAAAVVAADAAAAAAAAALNCVGCRRVGPDILPWRRQSGLELLTNNACGAAPISPASLVRPSLVKGLGLLIDAIWIPALRFPSFQWEVRTSIW